MEAQQVADAVSEAAVDEGAAELSVEPAPAPAHKAEASVSGRVALDYAHARPAVTAPPPTASKPPKRSVRRPLWETLERSAANEPVFIQERVSLSMLLTKEDAKDNRRQAEEEVEDETPKDDVTSAEEVKASKPSVCVTLPREWIEAAQAEFKSRSEAQAA